MKLFHQHFGYEVQTNIGAIEPGIGCDCARRYGKFGRRPFAYYD